MRFKGLITLVILLFSTISGFAKVDKLRCMWRTDPATTMVVGWNQISGQYPELCYGTIDGGTDSNFYPNCAKPSRSVYFKGMNNQFARLENLIPDTEYYFIILDEEGVSRRYSFRTAPSDPYTRMSIVAGGDSRNYRSARQRANQIVAKLRPNLVMFGGDMTGGDSDKEWIEWMDDWQFTITDNGRITPIVATRGNHEFSNRSIIDLFDVPSESVYYSLSFGGDLLKVFTLNSLIASGGDQKKWLEEELSNSGYFTWKMAQYHYAIRPHTARKTERNNQLSNWGIPFHEYNMDLVVESDAHCVKTTWPVRPQRGAGSEEGFIRDDENGTVYVGEGCWGAPLRRNNDDKKWTRNSGSFNQFKWIFVDRDGIEVRTVKTDNAAQVASVDPYDRFTPPPGIDIWNPSNGSVIFIENKKLAQLNNSGGVSSVSMKSPYSKWKDIYPAIANAEASHVNDGIQIEWEVTNDHDPANMFLLQRITESGDFETFAQVKGSFNQATSYKIADKNAHLYQSFKGYRILSAIPGRESQITPVVFKISSADKVKAVKVSESEIPRLSPDENSGYLRVKYRLEEKSDVSIRLFKESKEFSTSRYQNQRQGNYLKSIDMSDMPEGNYDLIIKVNEKLLHKYSISK